MDSELTGQNAEAVFRDKITGKDRVWVLGSL